MSLCKLGSPESPASDSFICFADDLSESRNALEPQRRAWQGGVSWENAVMLQHLEQGAPDSSFLPSADHVQAPGLGTIL